MLEGPGGLQLLVEVVEAGLGVDGVLVKGVCVSLGGEAYVGGKQQHRLSMAEQGIDRLPHMCGMSPGLRGSTGAHPLWQMIDEGGDTNRLPAGQ